MTCLEADNSHLCCLWLRTLSCVYLSAVLLACLTAAPPGLRMALSNFTSFPVSVLSRLPHYPPAPGCHYHVLGTLLFWGLNTQSTGVCCWRFREKGAEGIRAGPATEACHPSPTFFSGISCCSQFLLILSLSLPHNRRWAQGPQLLPPKRPPRL